MVHGKQDASEHIYNYRYTDRTIFIMESSFFTNEYVKFAAGSIVVLDVLALLQILLTI